MSKHTNKISRLKKLALGLKVNPAVTKLLKKFYVDLGVATWLEIIVSERKMLLNTYAEKNSFTRREEEAYAASFDDYVINGKYDSIVEMMKDCLRLPCLRNKYKKFIAKMILFFSKNRDLILIHHKKTKT